MKRIVIITLLLTAVSAVWAQPAPGTPWTLQDCIAYALEHNLTVQQSALTVQQREIDLNTARNNRLPAWRPALRRTSRSAAA